MILNTGDVAPDFSLYSSEKNLVSLSSYRGKSVMLLFFPFAFSSVCTQELCMVRDQFETYYDLNTEILGISVDSVYSLSRFKEDQQFTFQLLSDFNKETSRAYCVLHDEFAYGMKGVSKRAAFLISEEGIVEYAEVLEYPEKLPDFDAIQKTLTKLNLN